MMELLIAHVWVWVYYACLLCLVYWVAKILLWYTGSLESTVGIPPGNQGLPLIGETLSFMAAINSTKGFYEFVRVRRLRYGNCFKTKIFRETHVFISSTESAKTILNNDLGKFTKRYIKSIAELVGDQSLLCASQLHHKLIRSRLINLFSTNSMSSFIKEFDQMVVRTLSCWENGGTVIALDEALKITSKAMCKMLISLEDEDKLEMFQKDVGYICEAMLAFPLRLPWTRFYKGLQVFENYSVNFFFKMVFLNGDRLGKLPSCQKQIQAIEDFHYCYRDCGIPKWGLKDARKRVMNTLEKMINERRGLKAHHEDFLDYLLKDWGDESPSLTDAQIKDNILTMIIAGQDTTASAITWMVKYLDENQEVLDMLRAEQLLLRDEASKPKSYYITLEDLNEMTYASKVVKESLRMASVVPWFPRLALQDCEIHGYNIKKGWNINVDAKSIHLDPTLYNDPNTFIPSRFDEEPKPYSFLAFGTGGRTCLGINLAKAMMLVFLHRLVTTYKWKVIDSDSSIEKWALFSRLKSGCPIRVTDNITSP